VPTDPKTLQAAHLLVEQYGLDAVGRAEEMMHALATDGDTGGYLWWCDVATEVAAIIDQELGTAKYTIH
jgi:hypothetical protein